MCKYIWQWPVYWLAAGMGVNRQPAKTNSTAPLSPSVFCQFQKCPQWLTLWMDCQCSKCFWKRYKAAWPLRGEPISGHAVPTAAVCSSAGKLPGHFHTHVFTYGSHRQQPWSCRCCCGAAGRCKTISHVTVYKKPHKTGAHSSPFQLLW